MKLLGAVGMALHHWLVGFKWYQKVVDELKDDNATAQFRARWKLRPDESIEDLKIRHELYLEGLRKDFEDRTTSLQNIYQSASVTLAVVSLGALALAQLSGMLVVHSYALKMLVFVIGVLLWQLVGSYMPKFVKTRVPFMDAGDYQTSESIKPPLPGEKPIYPGELLYRSRAENLIFHVNVRNKILTKARRRLAYSHKLIQLLIIIGVLYAVVR